MKTRRVKSAKLHHPYFTTGTGQIDKTLDAQNYSNMKLAYTEYGLEVLYRGAYFVIPTPSVAGMTFFPDEECPWDAPKPSAPAAVGTVSNPTGKVYKAS